MQIRRFFYAYPHNNRTDGFLTHSARNTMMRTKHDLAKIKKIEKFPSVQISLLNIMGIIESIRVKIDSSDFDLQNEEKINIVLNTT